MELGYLLDGLPDGRGTELGRTIVVQAPTRRKLLAGVTMSLGGLALSSTGAWAGNDEEVACPAESIHQEPIFKASRKRV